MNEFEEKDYGTALSLATAIQGNADNIMDIFNDVDNVMNQLYGQNWESCGAENAQGRYNEIRRNYEIFYTNVVAMKTHIEKVTAANQDADSSASNVVTSI